MSEETKIEWATATFNPWEGCTKVSPGCTHCYAEARNHRFGGDNWGKGKPRRRTSVAYWKKPLRWDREAFRNHDAQWKDGTATNHNHVRPRIFPSLCDWLDEEVPIEWLADFLKLIHDTPNLDWLLLTKRPENWRGRMQEALTLWEDAPECAEQMSEFLDSWMDCIDMPERGNVPQNVWIGTSVENQGYADKRIPELLKIPAKVRFLSVEPLLGPVRIKDALHCDVPIHWVIVGGESGPGARPCNVDWIRSVKQQCAKTNVPCFVKQLGKEPRFDVEGTRGEGPMEAILHLTHPKGGDMAEWPEDLRVREFP